MPITIRPPLEIRPEPPTDLISSDGVPMEDGRHRAQMNLLIDSIHYHWRGRQDYFTGGDMFLYFSDQKVFNKDFRGPDFFVVKDCDWKPEREYWATWKEGGQFPDLIVEIISESTFETDRVEKKKLYAGTFRTPEYYCYDPDEPRLEAFHLVRGKAYSSKKVVDGKVWSPELDAFVGIWEGTYQKIRMKWLRLFDRDGNPIPTETEAEKARADQEKKLTDQEKARADLEKSRADQEKARADQEKSRADQEQARADALEAELKKLRESQGRPKRNGASK